MDRSTSAKGGRSKVPNESVHVIVRCRPISQKEKAEKNEIVTTIYPNRGVVEIASSENKENRKVFTYDAVYDHNANQKTVYTEVVRPLVTSVLDGFNGCIFAYGQTGTGNTISVYFVLRKYINLNEFFDPKAKPTQWKVLLQVKSKWV